MDDAYKQALLQKEESELLELVKVEAQLNKRNTLSNLQDIADQLIDNLCSNANKMKLEEILSDLIVIKVNREAVSKYKGAIDKLNLVQSQLLQE